MTNSRRQEQIGIGSEESYKQLMKWTKEKTAQYSVQQLRHHFGTISNVFFSSIYPHAPCDMIYLVPITLLC